MKSKIILTLNVQFNRRSGLTQVVDDLASVLARVFTIYLKDVKSCETEVVGSAVPVSALQYFPVEVPLDAHVGVRVRLNSAFVMSALTLN